METTHRVHVGDARDLSALADDSVDLVVTSPPYPMIEMWDDVFAELDPDIGDALDAGDGQVAFEAMHDVLREVWAAVERVLVPGGIACVNVGDATRSVGDRFRVYQNHARVVDAFQDLGFDPLPEVLWRKPVNSAAKFMGSGMVPPNAYVTLEHEYVLVFRNGGRRSFPPGDDQRYESAYFWEERNRWFSDVWTDVGGERQTLADDALRERSGAFPLELPYRLVSMYSVYGDTVLDPFWGTGTTSLAAMVAGRSSVGVERDRGFVSAFDDRATEAPVVSREVNADRLAAHREFVAERRASGEDLGYVNEHYDVPVRTRQETDLRLYDAASVTDVTDASDSTDRRFRVEHAPHDP
ncbi:site-specific DNA-methyltransferase [Halorubellus sp. JP-L1]|uniref:DNA-methyltransferase n=1 Tax=Halorubellus sp. JP-L1 TaxID=2715753 RepID=UPI0014075E6F|nr:site-specific DNA-methyltransferase [Halorubellus sp. JP-L1]NHN40622.1 site-specific DNA-methyltransferase [Halorubellus sp. JP-L1]